MARTTRRGALAAGGAAMLAAGCRDRPIPGTLGGADVARGHALRDRRLPPPQGPVREAGIVIAGGGIAGLAAGWTLTEAGFDDFELLELEDAPGGNARSGRNAISAYPLGAHYLPVPNREARALRHMLARFGIVTGERDGAPLYDPWQLCADLEQRLFWRGRWQEGLFPQTGLSDAERAEHAAFEAAMRAFSAATGADGKPAFAIPMAYSSSDPAYTALDATSFAHWLDVRGWRSRPLRAYVRYCCRDDYGAEPEDVSAWAGIHYFAGRRGWAANGDGDRELTWPEGNARLAALMAAPLGQRLKPGHSVLRIAREEDGGGGTDDTGGSGSVLVDCHDHRTGVTSRIRARAVIAAMPHFVAARVLEGASPAATFRYSPWVVANVSVSRRPGGPGAALAWDNVSAASESLGYVVATHQTSSAASGPTVLTWYMPLSRHAPEVERKALLARPLGEWQRLVRDDLVRLHPELDDAITRIDVWRWGHAMVRPNPGFLTDPARIAARAPAPPVFRAHSDLSGLSLFEEAHYHGVAAAEAAMTHLGHAHESLL